MTAELARQKFAAGPIGYWAIPDDGSGMVYGNDLMIRENGTGLSAYWCLGDSQEHELEWEFLDDFKIRLRYSDSAPMDWYLLSYGFRDTPLKYHKHSAQLCEVGKAEGVWTIPECLHYHGEPR